MSKVGKLSVLMESDLLLPPGAGGSTLDRLESSPRHQEWVGVKSGAREVQYFVVYPEVSQKAMEASRERWLKILERP